jgi:hypothetical protein
LLKFWGIWHSTLSKVFSKAGSGDWSKQWTPTVIRSNLNQSELKSFYRTWRDPGKAKDFPDVLYYLYIVIKILIYLGSHNSVIIFYSMLPNWQRQLGWEANIV